MPRSLFPTRCHHFRFTFRLKEFPVPIIFHPRGWVLIHLLFPFVVMIGSIQVQGDDTLWTFTTSGILNNLKSYYDLRYDGLLQRSFHFVLFHLIALSKSIVWTRGVSFRLMGWDLMIAGKLDWVHDDPIAKNTCQNCHGEDGFHLPWAHWRRE